MQCELSTQPSEIDRDVLVNQIIEGKLSHQCAKMLNDVSDIKLREKDQKIALYYKEVEGKLEEYARNVQNLVER